MKIEEGKVFLTFSDGKEKELDPTNPDDLKKLAEQAEKGYEFEGGQTKLKSVELERQKLQDIVTNWNNRLDIAKKDEKAREELIADLKAQGIDLTAKQEENMGFVEDKAQQQLDKLSSEVQILKEENDKLQGYVLNQYYETEHAQNESKYSKDNGYPEYDRKAVQEYADSKGIVSFETAYLEMNKEDIIKEQVEFQRQKSTNHMKKIKKVATQPFSHGDPPNQKPKVYKKYNEANADWAKDIANGTAEPLFIE